MREALAAAFDLGEDSVDTRSPSIVHRFIVPCGEELIDSLLELLDAAEGAAPDGLLLQLGKPALDKTEPAGAGRDKMQHETWALAQPDSDAGVAVDGVVIENQVQTVRGRKLTLDSAKLAQELLIAVPWCSAMIRPWPT